MLPLVWMLGVAVRNDHFCERQPVEDSSLIALVVVGYVVQNDALLVVEADVHLPILPFDCPAVDLEGNALGLCNVDRLDVFAISTLGFNSCRGVIVRRCLVHRSSHRGNIDMSDFLRVCIEDGSEVERECVLAVVGVRPIVHQGLL